MGVGEIGGSEVAGKGSTERGGAEILPEPAVESSRFETRNAFCIKTDGELVSIDQSEARTWTRQLPTLADELKAGID